MPTVFEKLNLKSQKSILVLNAPDSFEKELDTLNSTVKVHRQMDKVKSFEFARKAGFDTVRAVAIDEDWSALRFRRAEFIKGAK